MAYCNWRNTSELNLKYHDTEWGIPLWDDRGQFEFLMMEVMQCGLNWNMMINKREIFRSCFDNFEYDKIAEYEMSKTAISYRKPRRLSEEQKNKAKERMVKINSPKI